MTEYTINADRLADLVEQGINPFTTSDNVGTNLDAVSTLWSTSLLHGYDVPTELVMHEVEKGVLVEQVKKGDRIANRTDYTTVETVDAKTKWVTLRGSHNLDGSPQVVRLERGTEINVTRKVEDERSADIRMLDQELRRLVNHCIQKHEAVQANISKLSDHVGGYSNLYSEFEAISTAQSEWRNVYGAMVAYVGRERDGETVTLLDAYLHVKKELTDNLLNNRYRGQSTSEWSNAEEHTMQKVASEFVRGAYHVSMIDYLVQKLEEDAS